MTCGLVALSERKKRMKREVKQELWLGANVVASAGRIRHSIFHGEKFRGDRKMVLGLETSSAQVVQIFFCSNKYVRGIIRSDLGLSPNRT